MTSFETEVYNREDDNVIGARVIVVADNGQTIDSIQVTNKTQFDELKAKLDTLNEDYTQFDENSSLAGLTIDEILANTDEVATINATTLGGIQSDGFAKASHTHLKKSITDLYNYDITASNYNMNRGSDILPDKQSTISVKVTNMNNTPVSGHQVIIYKNGTLWKTGTTNNQGIFSSVYTAETEGIVTFQVNNQKVQCNVKYDTGWVEITDFDDPIFGVYDTNNKPSARRIGNVVHVRGVAKSLTTYPLVAFTDYINVFMLPDSRFYPTKTENFVIQTSTKQRANMQIWETGAVVIGRFTNANNSGEYTIPKNLWIPVSLTFFVG